MVKYSCEKCGKDFTQKSHYTNHMNRKNPCVMESKVKEIISTIVDEKIKIHNTLIQYIPETTPETTSETKKIKYIDLFCGMGSFHYSFNKMGWECVMSCDIDKAAKETYKSNYGLSPLDDVIEIDPRTIPNYDILCAGFPCQPFSQCGHHKGFDDERGTLFFNIMKFIEYHNPKIIILENVQGLLKHDSCKTFEKIKYNIQTKNYTIAYTIIKCSDYGLPQMRKRLIIIGIRNDTNLVKYIDKLLIFDEYKKEKTLSELLGKKFEKEIAYTIRCGGKNSPINDKHNWDGYIVDGKEYRLTIEDCLKIQGFDANFKLYGNNSEQWKQLGNTIPTIFTEIIGLNINKYLQIEQSDNTIQSKITDQYVLSKIEENKNSKKIKIIQELKIIAPSLNDDKLLQLYNKSISIHQSKMQGNGYFLENDVLVKILNDNNIPYKKQVTIDKTGIIVGFNEKKVECYHIVDFVIGENIDVGKSIIEYIVISCKTTCRERWTQDDWSHTFIPKLYLLLTISKDYPSSKRFRENIQRKIITCTPKKRDDRKYKLGFENLIDELNTLRDHI